MNPLFCLCGVLGRGIICEWEDTALPENKAHKGKGNTAKVAERLIRPILEEFGLELWDVRFEKEGGSWFLRYFIDREGGVSIGDCERVSRAVDKLLDEADPIEQSYVLEVSSPGIERALVKDRHFARYLGHPVHVRLIRPAEGTGTRDFVGELLGKEGDAVTVLLDGDVEMTFYQSEAAFIKLYAEFETGGLE